MEVTGDEESKPESTDTCSDSEIDRQDFLQYVAMKTKENGLEDTVAMDTENHLENNVECEEQQRFENLVSRKTVKQREKSTQHKVKYMYA